MMTEAKSNSDMVFHGRGWKFGHDVPTDRIVPTRLLFSPMSEIVQHVLEGLKPEFPKEVKAGDIIVAGKHFGQSSGRAKAPKALRLAGVSCIVAESFARTFLRNCFEIGLPIIECPGASELAEDGDIVRVDLVTGLVRNETRGVSVQCRPCEEFLMTMLRAGGLIALVKERGADWGAPRV